jgi:formate-dependent phosphoribosylglycinamide formyltransferase (GAR transformylase)
MNANSTVLCVGAGEEHVPSIRQAQEMGLCVAVADGNASAPGMQIADVRRVIDIADEQTVIRFACEQKVAFVLPVPLGRLLTTVGAVNDALGLTGLTRQAAENCTDKLIFHKKLSAAGLSRPRQVCVDHAEDLYRATAAVGFPCVVKPRFGSGKKGVVVISGPESVESVIRDTKSWTRDSHRIVEELMGGKEVGIDGVVIADRLTLILVREKLVTPLPHRQEIQYVAPARLPAAVGEELHSVIERAVNTLGLSQCLIHADVLIDEEGQCRIIEIAGRPAGLLIMHLLIPAVLGISVLREFTRFGLAKPYNFSPRFTRSGALSFLRLPSGRIGRMPDPVAVRAMDHITEYQCLLERGMSLSTITCSGDVLARGHILAVAPTHCEAISAIEGVLDQFQVLEDYDQHAEPISR